MLVKIASVAVGLVATFVTTDARATTLFDEDAVLDIRLAGPIGELVDNRKEKKEMSFVLSAEGVDHEVLVRARGHSRLRVCNFAMLRLEFGFDSVATTVFENQDKLKLVTHCREGKRAGQDLLQEYIAYRIFGLLTDVSYRVRLLRIDYVDINEPDEVPAQYPFAFAVEPDDELARRIAANKAERDGISRSMLNPEQAALVYVFQYLIGNTDWSIVRADEDEFCCHNIELFEIGSELFPVPRDFDLAGLVNAPYAKPDASLRISRVTQRLYRGYCVQPDTLQSALQKINALQADIMALPETIPGLAENDRRLTSKYLAKFFDKARDERRLLDQFEARCL
jgi:hypothetical protein